jgi:hypothetical protein
VVVAILSATPLLRSPYLPLPVAGERSCCVVACTVYCTCSQWTNGTSGQAGRASEHGPCGCATAHGCCHPRCQVKGTDGRPVVLTITWWAPFLSVPLKVLMRRNTTAISRESYVNLRQSMHTVKRNQARVSVLLELVIRIWLLATLIDVSPASCWLHGNRPECNSCSCTPLGRSQGFKFRKFARTAWILEVGERKFRNFVWRAI